ncbi:MAG: bifunctional 4-hydroxy-2-oxoglutarate aldolase/2-dehydro-3-deoxy-phosphogluconate aldolase [Clostridiales bacterium]|nr:bifunctional 4-hydroxy-2-oxoglutarate aldolase/2-dehydro-3-deoxy-phosphogluconate aldolase [Clostridiales bacterium]
MLDQLALAGLIPIIKVQDAQDAPPLCKALMDGGLPVAEITFRTAAAEEAIKLVNAQYPDILLGAGTVLTTDQADRAWAAGARYIVSPGFNPRVVQHCLDKGYPILPGCSSPSDIEQAIELGLSAVKIFPAGALGGVATIKALAGPYTEMQYVPTGGVDARNLLEYLSFPKVLACGGSWMVPQSAVETKDWAKIQALASEAVDLLLGFEIVHIGVNSANEQDAKAAAERLSKLFHWPIREGQANYFVGTGVEIMKTPFLGAHGHVPIGTNSVERAQWHLEGRGFTLNEETARKVPDGKLRFVYLAEEIAGFAFHLIQK